MRFSFSVLLFRRVGSLCVSAAHRSKESTECPRPSASPGIAELVRALRERDVTTPFGIREVALPAALAGLVVLAEPPTGLGKTPARGLPLIERTANGQPARSRRRP